MSPTQRSLALLRERGYVAAVTEKWNSFTKHRVDLFGFIDVLAVCGPETLAVQATSTPNMAARVNKIIALAEARAWLEGGMRRIVVHGWAKRVVIVGSRKCDGKPIKRKQYQVRIVEITLSTLADGDGNESLSHWTETALTPKPATQTVTA